MRKIKELKLRNGKKATISFLTRSDSAEELNSFINELVDEGAKIVFDREVSLKDEKAWIKNNLDARKKNEGYLLIARVDGRIAGTSGANRERGRGRGNVFLGLAIAKPFRRIGLGEALMRNNIETAKIFFRPKPDIIYLSVFGNNKPAISLYHKLGFRIFAAFPEWLPYKGRRVDHLFMMLVKR
jgi:ribosomal protein S18 acetylase RimI-like enzyme